MKNEKTPEQVAEHLHKAMCAWNHTDGCDWFYSDWNSSFVSYSRNKFLVLANKFISSLAGDVEKACEAASILSIF